VPSGVARVSEAAERLADVARMAAQGDDLTALATARGFEAIVEAITHAGTEIAQTLWQVGRPQ
jgi:hypothetical protein